MENLVGEIIKTFAQPTSAGRKVHIYVQYGEIKKNGSIAALNRRQPLYAVIEIFPEDFGFDEMYDEFVKNGTEQTSRSGNTVYANAFVGMFAKAHIAWEDEEKGSGYKTYRIDKNVDMPIEFMEDAPPKMFFDKSDIKPMPHKFSHIAKYIRI